MQANWNPPYLITAIKQIKPLTTSQTLALFLQWPCDPNAMIWISSDDDRPRSLGREPHPHLLCRRYQPNSRLWVVWTNRPMLTGCSLPSSSASIGWFFTHRSPCCLQVGLILPIFIEETWPVWLRIILYFLALCYRWLPVTDHHVPDNFDEKRLQELWLFGPQ